MRLLTPAQICEINESMCREFGGLWVPPDNLRIPGGLDLLLDQLTGEVFGVAGPTSPIAAAAYQFVFIIRGHVFHDGNKRTALQVALEFLEANGVSVRLDATAETLAVAVAEGGATETEVERWLGDHVLVP